MAKSESSARERSGWDLKTLLGIFVVVVLLWAGGGYATLVWTARFKDHHPDVTLSETGTFGDTFGAVNSLFSALGVAGVAYALILQFREQKDARIDAEVSRKHDANLAMLAARIYAHAVLLEYSRNLLNKFVSEHEYQIDTKIYHQK